MRRFWRMNKLMAALRDRLGYRRFLIVCRKYQADRQRIEAAAALLTITVEKLVELLAIQIDFPYLATVPPTSLSVLPRRIGFAELRRLEILPLASAGVISGFVTVNPDRVCDLFPDHHQLPIFISTPRAVSEALTYSERSLQLTAQHREISREELIRAAISRMMEHAIALGDQCFYIKEIAGQLCYEVRVALVPPKRGVIAEDIASEVLALCVEHSLHRKFLNLSNHEYSVTITRAEDVSEYCLRKIDLLSTSLSITEPPLATSDLELCRRAGSAIMVIDDNRDFLRVLERFLARAGFIVTCVESATHALRHIEFSQEWPRAIVTDLHMPEMSGLEFIEQLSRRYGIDIPPILFLTSDESVYSEMSALKRGALCFIPKSRDPRVLVAHLERICGSKPGTLEAA
jgi:CheY-like chemotaxis protein